MVERSEPIDPAVVAIMEAWDKKTGRTSCPTPPKTYLKELNEGNNSMDIEDGTIHPDVLATMERWDRITGRSSRPNSTGPLSYESRKGIGNSLRVRK
jgi:hypothetical protein